MRTVYSSTAGNTPEGWSYAGVVTKMWYERYLVYFVFIRIHSSSLYDVDGIYSYSPIGLLDLFHNLMRNKFRTFDGKRILYLVHTCAIYRNIDIRAQGNRKEKKTDYGLNHFIMIRQSIKVDK